MQATGAALRTLSAFALAFLGIGVAVRRAPEPRGEVTVEGRTLRFAGTLYAARYGAHPRRFHGHHAITWGGGSMGGKALIRTPVPDREIAAALAALGVADGGGIPREAWARKDDPAAPEPDQKAAGAPLEVHVRWAGGPGWVPLASLLRDGGAPADLDLRFADNRRWIPDYGSGCVVCLASCPGSKIANARYSIRQNDRGPMDYTPGPDLPPDGTPVEIRIRERAAGK